MFVMCYDLVCLGMSQAVMCETFESSGYASITHRENSMVSKRSLVAHTTEWTRKAKRIAYDKILQVDVCSTSTTRPEENKV